MFRDYGTYAQGMKWLAGLIAEGKFEETGKVAGRTLEEWYEYYSVAEDVELDIVKADVIAAVTELVQTCVQAITYDLPAMVERDKKYPEKKRAHSYSPDPGLYLYAEELIPLWDARFKRIKAFLGI